MESDLVWTVISCLATLTVTFLFNYIVQSPKRKKKEREEEEQRRKEERAADQAQRQKELEEIHHKINECKSSLDIRFDQQENLIEEHKKIINKRLDEQGKNIKSVMNGLQAELKNNLKIRYKKWIKLGYAPADAKEDLERIYQAYHKLGANGIMDKLRDEFLELPEDKNSKNISNV